MPYRHLAGLLDSRYETLSPELQRAARWVREHPAELGLQSMRQSARAADVSPATMTRLAQALGLDGFEAMRRPVMAAVARTLGDASASAMALADPASTADAAQHDALARNVASVGQRNTPARLDDAARAVLVARRVVFLGLRAAFGIAHHLHYTCDWLRPGTQLAHDAGGAWADVVATLSAHDLLVVVSQAPYARETVDAVRAAAAAGVPVLALTDSPLSPVARVAGCVLFYDAASPSYFHSMTGAMALAETLMRHVAEAGGDAVVQRLAERQQQLQRVRAYWDEGTRTARAPGRHASGRLSAPSRKTQVPRKP